MQRPSRPARRLFFDVVLTDSVDVSDLLIEYALAAIAFVWLRHYPDYTVKGHRPTFLVEFRPRLEVPGLGTDASGQHDWRGDPEAPRFRFGTNSVFARFDDTAAWHLPLIVCAGHEAMHAVQQHRGDDPSAAGEALLRSGTDAYLSHPLEVEADGEGVSLLAGHEADEGLPSWVERGQEFSLADDSRYREQWDQWAQGIRCYQRRVRRLVLPPSTT